MDTKASGNISVANDESKSLGKKKSVPPCSLSATEIGQLPPETLLYIGQAATLRGVSKVTIMDMLEAGELPFRWVGGQRRIPKWCVIESDREFFRKQEEHKQELLRR